MRPRYVVEISKRHGSDPAQRLFHTRREVKVLTKTFNKHWTAVERVENRISGSHKPIDLTVEVKQTKTLKQSGSTLTDILDTLRYIVHTHVFAPALYTCLRRADLKNHSRLAYSTWTPLTYSNSCVPHPLRRPQVRVPT